jgi:hypothetical protein
MSEPENYDLVLKCAEVILDSLHAEAEGDVDYAIELWMEDPNSYFISVVPFTSDRCTCGNNGSELEWHQSSCYLLVAPLERAEAAWRAYFDLCEQVEEVVDWRLAHEAGYLSPEEQAEVDAEVARLESLTL